MELQSEPYPSFLSPIKEQKFLAPSNPVEMRD